MAFRLVVEHLYRGHSYRMPLSGRASSVQAMSPARLRRFYRRNYPLSEMTLAVVGDVEPRKVLARIRRRFAHIPRRGRSARAKGAAPFREARSGARQVFGFMEREQAHIAVGFPGIAVADGDRYALEVLVTLLGGQGGRLFTRLRDELGLAYRVGAYSHEGIEPGVVAFYAACADDCVDEVLGRLRAEIEAVTDRPPGAKELGRVKRHLLGVHEVALQQRSARAAGLALHEAYGLGFAEFGRYTRAIRAVRPRDVQRVAKRLLVWEKALIATVMRPRASPEAARRTRGRVLRAPGGKARTR